MPRYIFIILIKDDSLSENYRYIQIFNFVFQENGEGSDSLLAVDVPVVSNDECRRAYRSLTSRMFCAGVPQGGKDACQV